MPTKPLLLALCLATVPLAGCTAPADPSRQAEQKRADLQFVITESRQCYLGDNYRTELKANLTNTGDYILNLRDRDFQLTGPNGTVWDVNTWPSYVQANRLHPGDTTRAAFAFPTGQMDPPFNLRVHERLTEDTLSKSTTIYHAPDQGRC